MNKFISLISLPGKNKIFSFLAILSTLLLSTALLADEQSQQPGADEGQPPSNQSQESNQGFRVTGSYSNIYKATGVIGTTVKNKQDKKLGEISDLVIDKSGQVKYAVLTHGETLGVGGKKTAISWDLIQFSSDGKKYSLVLDATPEELENAPSFNKDNWPANAQVTDTSSLQGQQQSSDSSSTDQDSTSKGSQSQQGGNGNGANRTVTVQEGDTLADIAHHAYGDASKWRLIYNANKDKIKDPKDLLVGTKLTIPSPNE
ncbi:PRC-barrel domain-containing protein [Nitrosococcus watsonii]|uniref:PRC-barrel domain protein n=1 Tax=Nitrosococcus watsoni (strain C-113) TaxID=105559 RepID=D8KA50_NITWC|nr:PRC-barrel domain-containing protein [Nitrosococcus watsonii]ADJ29408.1 PRC-barrel domain protein [Nitrosococcus watsonii C-113]